MLAAALVAVAALRGGGYSAPDNVHGAVYSWARANPGEDVPVLLQLRGDSAEVTEQVVASGGSVGREFNIIAAVEATVPVSGLASLANQQAVAWISLDAPVVSTAIVDTTNLVNTYPFSVNANPPWALGYAGTGVRVAVVDTGISPITHEDFKSATGVTRVVAQVEVNANTTAVTDGYGHGTHIAGTIGGDGSLLNGKYIGIAPEAHLINVKIADDLGNATLADVIAGLEWVYTKRASYKIKVVNLSLTSTVAQSYKTDPLCSAVESLWLNGVFVVVAAGNLGSAPDAVNYCPGNDPFVMTVGAIDDMGTRDFSDDVMTDWSSRGVTQDGFTKPDLLAPGRGIVSLTDTNSELYKKNPGNVVDNDYLTLSGTSMATGVMSGVGALVQQKQTRWTPGQLKCTLVATGRSLSGGSWRVADAGKAFSLSKASCDSNTGRTPSTLLAPPMKAGVIAYVLGQSDPNLAASTIGLDMIAAGIQGATLSSVDWSAIKWSAIKWSAIKWSSVNWSAIKWSAIKWSAIKWSEVSPDGVDWSAIKWSAIKWSAISWDAIKWSSITWSATNWDAIKWSAIKWGEFPE